MLLAYKGKGLWALLSITQCTGQTPVRKNYLALNVESAKAEKPCET